MMKIPKLFFVFAMIFGFTATTFAQEVSKEPVGLNFNNVTGTSTEISAWQEECRRTDNVTSGTCIVTVGYKSDSFPVRFIQNGKVLEQVDSAEAGASGFEAVQGVEYYALPNGGMEYMLEIRNPRGGTFIFKRIGA